MAISNRQFPSVTMVDTNDGLDARIETSNGYEFLRVTQDESGSTKLITPKGKILFEEDPPPVEIDNNVVTADFSEVFFPDNEPGEFPVTREDCIVNFFINGKKVANFTYDGGWDGDGSWEAPGAIVLEIDPSETETGQYEMKIELTLPSIGASEWWLPDYNWVDGETYRIQASIEVGHYTGSNSHKSNPVEYVCKIDTLETPEIEFSENINVITWPAIDFAEGYDILIDGEKVADVTYNITEYDLRDLHLVAGLYAISIAATSTVYKSSEPSNTLIYEQLNIGTLEETDWSIIKMYSDKGSSFWDIGDTKSVTLNGQITDREDVPVYNNATYYVYIIGFNHDNYEDVPSEYRMGITFAGFMNTPEDKILIALDGRSDTNQSIYQMNIDATSKYTWKDSNMRNNIIGSTNNSGSNPDGTELTNPKENSLMALIDSDFRSVLSPMYVETYITWSNPNQKEITIDYCKLFSTRELISSSTRDEGRLYKFFETNNVYNYKRDGYALDTSSLKRFVYFWLRSNANYIGYPNPYRYLTIDSQNKMISNRMSDNTGDIVPVFRVAPEQTVS